MDGIDEWHLEFQSRCFFHADRFAEARHDRGLVLVDDEEQRAPFQAGQNENESDDREDGILRETERSESENGPWAVER